MKSVQQQMQDDRELSQCPRIVSDFKAGISTDHKAVAHCHTLLVEANQPVQVKPTNVLNAGFVGALPFTLILFFLLTMWRLNK